jgi:DNA-binding GntR family transcriptional regulator
MTGYDEISERPFSMVRESFERIYKTICDRIWLLEYQPGECLSEEELANEFDVSRSPVGRVFSRLEREGLLETRHGGE